MGLGRGLELGYGIRTRAGVGVWDSDDGWSWSMGLGRGLELGYGIRTMAGVGVWD